MIGLVAHWVEGAHATHSFSREFLRCIPNSELLTPAELQRGTKSLEGFDILFFNRIENLRNHFDKIPPKAKVILWAHGVGYVFNDQHKSYVERCDLIGFTGPVAYQEKGGFLLEYGVCPFPTKGLANPYRGSRNIFYAGKIHPHTLEYLRIAADMGNLYIASVESPPADLKCTYIGKKPHGSFVEYYLYADASLDVPHQPNRTFVNCKVLDCIYYGLPVVVPGPMGGDHWIIESECGIVTEKQDPNQFREAMATVLDDPWRFRYAQKRLDQNLVWESRFKQCGLTKAWIDGSSRNLERHGRSTF